MSETIAKKPRVIFIDDEAHSVQVVTFLTALRPLFEIGPTSQWPDLSKYLIDKSFWGDVFREVDAAVAYIDYLKDSPSEWADIDAFVIDSMMPPGNELPAKLEGNIDQNWTGLALADYLDKCINKDDDANRKPKKIVFLTNLTCDPIYTRGIRFDCEPTSEEQEKYRKEHFCQYPKSNMEAFACSKTIKPKDLAFGLAKWIADTPVTECLAPLGGFKSEEEQLREDIQEAILGIINRQSDAIDGYIAQIREKKDLELLLQQVQECGSDDVERVIKGFLDYLATKK